MYLGINCRVAVTCTLIWQPLLAGWMNITTPYCMPIIQWSVSTWQCHTFIYKQLPLTKGWIKDAYVLQHSGVRRCLKVMHNWWKRKPDIATLEAPKYDQNILHQHNQLMTVITSTTGFKQMWNLRFSIALVDNLKGIFQQHLCVLATQGCVLQDWSKCVLVTKM